MPEDFSGSPYVDPDNPANSLGYEASSSAADQAAFNAQMQAQLSAMGPAPQGGDAQAMGAWLMKDPSIAAYVQQYPDTNVFQVAAGFGIIPPGYHVVGNGDVQDNAGQNAVLLGAAIMSAGLIPGADGPDPAALAGDAPVLEGTAAGPGAISSPVVDAATTGTGVPADVVNAASIPAADTAPYLSATGEATTATTALPTASSAGFTDSGPSALSSVTGGGPSTTSTLAQIAGAVGPALGKVATAAGQNNLNGAEVQVLANNSNTSGQAAYENELNARGTLEGTQRNTDLTDVLLDNYANNRPVNPFDPTPPMTVGPQALSTLNNLGQQGASALATPPQYSTTNMPAIPAYNPLNGSQLASPSTLSQVLGYTGAGLTAGSTIAKIAGLF